TCSTSCASEQRVHCPSRRSKKYSPANSAGRRNPLAIGMRPSDNRASTSPSQAMQALMRWSREREAEVRARLRGRLALLEPVTVVVDGNHAIARLGPQVELLAHLAHVRVYGARGEIARAAPHRFLQVTARHQAPDVAEEDHRQVELLGRELHLGAGPADFA